MNFRTLPVTVNLATVIINLKLEILFLVILVTVILNLKLETDLGDDPSDGDSKL